VSARVSCFAVTRDATRLNVTLPAETAAKLARLAERTHVQEGTLARSLLAQAIDEADPDARHVAEILDGIPGAWERVEEGLRQARAGETVPLDEPLASR
jgi:predicted transcriptional regulator